MRTRSRRALQGMLLLTRPESPHVPADFVMCHTQRCRPAERASYDPRESVLCGSLLCKPATASLVGLWRRVSA